MTPTKELQCQIEFLLDQFKKSEIDPRQFMVLLNMAYKDFLELNPEEYQYYSNKNLIDEIEKNVKKNYKLEI